MVLGGETGGASTDRVLVGTPAHLRAAGRLPVPTHDAAAALVGGAVYLFGGGQATSVSTVVRVNPATGAARTVGHMDEPLSDLGAVVVGGKAYLVGGYTSAKFASAILRWSGGGKTKTVARLGAGTRYAGVAAIGSTIYVAGGLLPTGPSDAVLSVGLHGGIKRVATLPAPQDHAALAVPWRAPLSRRRNAHPPHRSGRGCDGRREAAGRAERSCCRDRRQPHCHRRRRY